MSAETEVEFYSIKTLAEAAGVTVRTLNRDRKANIGKLNDAVIADGIGTMFAAKKAARYISIRRVMRGKI